MNQRLKKTTWRIPYTMTKEKFVSIINNCYPGLTWINVEQARPIFFFFTWFTQELDYKVKCTALTVLKISSIKIPAVEVLILLWHLIWKQKTLSQFKFIIFSFLLLQINIKNGLHFNSPRFPSSSLLGRWKIAGWGREGGTLQSLFIQGGSTLWSNLLPIYKRLLIKTVPLSNSFHHKMVTLSHT